jgi:peroxiredoxin
MAKAVPSIDARKRHLLAKTVPGIKILISNSPFMMQRWRERLPPCGIGRSRGFSP